MAEQIPARTKKSWRHTGHFAGSLGIHKFYLGYNTPASSWCWLPCSPAVSAGVMESSADRRHHLPDKTDEEFVATYVNGKKEWF